MKQVFQEKTDRIEVSTLIRNSLQRYRVQQEKKHEENTLIRGHRNRQPPSATPKSRAVIGNTVHQTPKHADHGTAHDRRCLENVAADDARLAHAPLALRRLLVALLPLLPLLLAQPLVLHLVVRRRLVRHDAARSLWGVTLGDALLLLIWLLPSS